MSIAGLLERGVRSVLSEPDSEAELRELLEARAVDAAAADHVRQTLEALPGLLVSLDGALAAPEAPGYARELFLVVLSYTLDDHNLIPSHEGRPLLGLLDDAYLLHAAALELEECLHAVDMRSIAGGAQLLEQVLPREVIGNLRDKVHKAKQRVGKKPGWKLEQID